MTEIHIHIFCEVIHKKDYFFIINFSNIPKISLRLQKWYQNAVTQFLTRFHSFAHLRRSIGIKTSISSCHHINCILSYSILVGPIEWAFIEEYSPVFYFFFKSRYRNSKKHVPIISFHLFVGKRQTLVFLKGIIIAAI